MSKKTRESALADIPPPSQRAYTVADGAEYHLRSDTEGRTVEAYVVPWGVPTEVTDVEGHYFEQFHKGAFGRQLKRTGLAGIAVLYNHGKDLHGRPSERFSLPLGTPVEIHEDGPGLFTATRYAKTELADDVLQLVREDAIQGHSVTFTRTPGGRGTKRIPRGHSSGLDLVERLDTVLIEYGPTPFPSYAGTGAVGVRAGMLASHIFELESDDRDELAKLLAADRSRSASDADRKGKGGADGSTSGVDRGLLALRHEQTQRRNERQ